MITERNFYIGTLIVLVAIMIGNAVFTVAATGDVRCLVVKCVVLKK